MKNKIENYKITKNRNLMLRDQRMQKQQRHIDYPKSIRIILTYPSLDQLQILLQLLIVLLTNI